MHRSNINRLLRAERRELARLIQDYVSPEIVAEHWSAVQSGVHTSPETFLSFHRHYINGLESFLLNQGRSNWLPLPKWNPSEPIPPEFDIPDTGPGRLRNLNPGISFSPQFDSRNLSTFRTEAELGMALMQQHNRVHIAIGGVMNNLRRAPEAPIFWPWHAFIDDIWADWQELKILHGGIQ